MIRRCRRTGLAVLAALASVACTSATSDGSTSGTSRSILVFAASSLSESFSEIERDFEAANPGVDVEVNLGGSSRLREQILAGAPADVFISASEPVMAQLREAGEVENVAPIVATNTLQLAVPVGNPAAVDGLADLADDDLLVGVCAMGVPCGDLARELLAGADVEASIDTNEPDVRSLVTKLEAGELDAGLVYASDVASSNGALETVSIASSVATRYPIAVLAGSSNPDDARRFVDFVTSPAGQAILDGFGFGAP